MQAKQDKEEARRAKLAQKEEQRLHAKELKEKEKVRLPLSRVILTAFLFSLSFSFCQSSAVLHVTLVLDISITKINTSPNCPRLAVSYQH